MSTERDKKMVKEWFERYDYATISMLQRTFFRHQEYGYNICRKRLLVLLKEDYIKVYKDSFSNKNIYVYNRDKIKLPSKHRLILLDLLAELNYLGFNIERFEIEKEWCGGKYRSDALLQFTADSLGNNKGIRDYFFVEVQISNNHHGLDKYDQLYKSGEVQNYLAKEKDWYPKILLVSDRNFQTIKLEHTKLLRVDTNLNSLASILL